MGLSFTLEGLEDSLKFWKSNTIIHQHITTSNGSMATQTVLPLFTMQQHGYDIHLLEVLLHYVLIIDNYVKTDITQKRIVKCYAEIDVTGVCPTCLFRQDWITIDDQ